MNHARAGDGKADAGAAREIANGGRRVGSGLLVAHVGVFDPGPLRVDADGDHGEADDAEHVVDALLLQRTDYDFGARDVGHVVGYSRLGCGAESYRVSAFAFRRDPGPLLNVERLALTGPRAIRMIRLQR